MRGRHGSRASRVRGARLLRWAATVAILSVIVALAAAATASAAEIDWHKSFEKGLEAAGDSGKPILVFVYISGSETGHVGERREISLPGSESSRHQQQLDRRRMLEETLTDPGVVNAAEAFEPVLLDLRLKANDSARERLKVSPVVSGSGERVGVYPITLFLDSNGDELFRRHGYLPANGYELQLERAATLFEKLDEIVEDPDDPVLRRELGRAYMEMDFSKGDPFYEAAVRHLEKAIELDPDNATGAKFDARVDLAILRLPDNPEEALGKLFQLQSEDEDGNRRLEIQYYMAVAQYVLEDYEAAMQILSRFETPNKDSRYYDSPWTPQALGLLQYLRRATGNDR